MSIGSDDFVSRVRSAAKLGRGHLVTRTQHPVTQAYNLAVLTYCRLPPDAAKVDPAAALANRLQVIVSGFGPRQHEAPPSGDVVLDFGGAPGYPNGKRGDPVLMADEVAGYITDFARERMVETVTASSR